MRVCVRVYVCVRVCVYLCVCDSQRVQRRDPGERARQQLRQLVVAQIEAPQHRHPLHRLVTQRRDGVVVPETRDTHAC